MLLHLVLVGALVKLQGVLGRDLQGEVARRPAVGAAEAEHDEHVGGPGTDPDHLGQRGVDLLVVRGRRAASGPDRWSRPSAIARSVRIFGRDSPAPARCRSSSASRTCGSNGAAGGRRAAPDRSGARHRYLLADDDTRQPLEAGGAAAQRRIAGEVVHAPHDGALAPQRPHAIADVAVRCDDPRQRLGPDAVRDFVFAKASSGDPTRSPHSLR